MGAAERGADAESASPATCEPSAIHATVGVYPKSDAGRQAMGPLFCAFGACFVY
jgi:hypothetical protein